MRRRQKQLAEEGKKVVESIIHALKAGGSVFIEVMTTHDPGAKTSREEDENMSETISFIKHFFDDGELAAWFSELETQSYEEIMKYDDSHGTPHYHGLARLIGRKRAA